MLVAPDSSMSMAEEIELDDTDMVCSTSLEPEMYYGEYIIRSITFSNNHILRYNLYKIHLKIQFIIKRV